MLLLSRKPSEKIYLNDAAISVVRLSGGQVLLGIDAPKGKYKVLLGELYEAEQECSASNNGEPSPSDVAR